MLPQSSYTIRARTWPVWIIFSLAGLPGIFLMIMEPTKKGGAWLFVAACLFSLLVYAISRSMKIYLDDEWLFYSAYGRTRRVRWSDMTASSVGWTIEGGHTASYSWHFRTLDNKLLEIPLGYYSRSDICLLANQVVSRAKNAKLSLEVHRFADGRFPWFLF